MLVNLLTDENVEVLCVQEVFGGDFPSLPPNQPFTCDGPTSSRGREAGFLFRSGVSGFAILGIEDALFSRWGVVDNSVCICSFYAPHAGLPEGERVAFWQELLSARHVRATSNLPMILAGDANVWHPHFNLGRQRPVDDPIVPLVNQLLSSCGLVLLNPPNVGTHSAGAALELVMMSSSCSGSVRVHDGMGRCNHAPACCRAQVPRCLPPLRDWHPVLLRAHNDFGRLGSGS